MNDTKSLSALPDHLSSDPCSRYHMEEIFERNTDTLLNGKQRGNVEQYCISEGWVKIPSPKAWDRRRQTLLVTLKGAVEASIIK